MSSVKLTFHPEAIEEVEAAAAWYAKRSRRAASQFVDELDAVMTFIMTDPDRWPVLVDDVQRALFSQFPYAVLFRRTPESLEVLAVAHGRRRPGYWRERLT